MADDIGSWISQAIITHDREHGANRNLPLEGRYVQLVEFSSYRTALDPDAEIRGIVSDSTHHVRVKFDIKATDEFEEPQASLPSESLTSHLRSIFHLQSYVIHLEPPISSVKNHNSSPGQPYPSPYPDLPRVVLEVKQWKVVGGSKDDPIYFDKTAELGRGSGKGEGKLQEVLRKWWFGESNSDPSQNQTSSMETPSRNSSNPRPLISSPANPTQYTPDKKTPIPPAPQTATTSIDLNYPVAQPGAGAIDKEGSITVLGDFLKPYLQSNGGKKRTIPEWLFETPEEVHRMLEDITIFALDLAVSSGTPRHDSVRKDAPVDVSGDRKGKARAIMPPGNAEENRLGPHALECAPLTSSIPFHDLAQSAATNSRVPHVAHPSLPSPSKNISNLPCPPRGSNELAQKSRSQHAGTDDDEDDDEEIPIRPVGGNRTRRKEIFDPLAMHSSSPAPLEDIDMGQADSDEDQASKLVRTNFSGKSKDQDEIHKDIEDDVFGATQSATREEDPETDEEDLSDYERNQRRAKRMKRIYDATQRSIVVTSPAVSTSKHTFTQEKRRSVSVSVGVQTDIPIGQAFQPANPNYGAHILVDDSDQSLPHPSQSQHVSDQSGLTNRPLSAQLAVNAETEDQKSPEPIGQPDTRVLSQSRASPLEITVNTQSDRGNEADISGSFEEHHIRRNDDHDRVQQEVDRYTADDDHSVPSSSANQGRTRPRPSVEGDLENDVRQVKKPKIEPATPLNIGRIGPSTLSQAQGPNLNAPGSIKSSGKSTRKSFLQSIRFFRSSPSQPSTPASPTAPLSEFANRSAQLRRHNSRNNDDAEHTVSALTTAKVDVHHGNIDQAESKQSPGLFQRLGRWAGEMPHYDQLNDDGGDEDEVEDPQIHIEEEEELGPGEAGNAKKEAKSEHQSRREIVGEEIDIKVKIERDSEVEPTGGRTVIRDLDSIDITDSDLDDLCTNDEADVGFDDEGKKAVEKGSGDFLSEAPVLGVFTKLNMERKHVVEGRLNWIGRMDDVDEKQHVDRHGSVPPSQRDLSSSDHGATPVGLYTSDRIRSNGPNLSGSGRPSAHPLRTLDDVRANDHHHSPVRERPQAPSLSHTPTKARPPQSPLNPTASLAGQSASPTSSLIQDLGGRARKLGGYELDLKVAGLSEKFVQRALETALATRKGKGKAKAKGQKDH
ncbi:hypothetical protein I317_04184 [Kwoniella heveanensis CBS 569]|nr:hypothetical protein I317_04184 [Kwoniella heveanensis CBS 569]